jgi:sn-glycerol 3-phosphate transport system ATP-binding protein
VITSGEIAIGDRVVNRLEPADRDIAMVFQNYALYPHMTVRQNMSYGLKIRGMKPVLVKERVDAVADSLGLTPLLERKPRQLSGGQRQRVAMGRAIVREPSVFLFDEPLSNLDAKLRVQMRLELELLHRRLGTTCLYVTHDQVEAITLADRMMVLNAGVVEQIGTPQEVYRTPASRFVAGFIGSPSMNLIPARRTRTGDILVDAAADPQPGSFTLGVRPEHLVPCPEADALLVVAVNVVENLGADSFAYGSIGSQEVVVRLRASTRSARGTGSRCARPRSTCTASTRRPTGGWTCRATARGCIQTSNSRISR